MHAFGYVSYTLDGQKFRARRFRKLTMYSSQVLRPELLDVAEMDVSRCIFRRISF